MCLQGAKQIKQKKELVCYKLLRKEGELYTSPFKYKEWIKDKTYTASFDAEVYLTNIICEDGAIRSGAFHSFKKRKDAVDYSRVIYWIPPSELCVARCIIPENNGYLYKGGVEVYSTDGMLEGYASEKLKIVDIKPLKRNY